MARCVIKCALRLKSTRYLSEHCQWRRVLVTAGYLMCVFRICWWETQMPFQPNTISDVLWCQQPNGAFSSLAAVGFQIDSLLNLAFKEFSKPETVLEQTLHILVTQCLFPQVSYAHDFNLVFGKGESGGLSGLFLFIFIFDRDPWNT